ncbi:MAG: hypothetical protein IJ480_03885 [Clostridia bacterium]|nr:hypothetical protein [Clostridia bacterium]
MGKWKKLTGMAEKLRSSGTIWRLAALFCAGLVLAGGRAFLGSWPMGLAASAAASGLLGAAAVFFGALLGSANTGGIMPLVTAGVFVLRAGLSMWLATDKEGYAGVFPGSTAGTLRNKTDRFFDIRGHPGGSDPAGSGGFCRGQIPEIHRRRQRNRRIRDRNCGRDENDTRMQSCPVRELRQLPGLQPGLQPGLLAGQTGVPWWSGRTGICSQSIFSFGWRCPRWRP